MLAEHLREAVSINMARKSIYSKLSEGKSRSLSNRLIFFECLLILPAMFFDKKAKRFNKKGIPIMKNDFVSMKGLPQAKTPTKFIKTLPKNELKELIINIIVFNKAVKSELKVLNFKKILIEGKNLLEYIINTENKFECHLAMIKHVIESMNFITANGISYAKKSSGKTLMITKKMIEGHVFLMKPSLKTIDIPAQNLHSIGCGIIVNDMPEIPSLVD